MTDAQKVDQFQEFSRVLTEKTKTLIEHVETGDLHAAVRVIQDIQEVRNAALFNEIGRLTRTLHESITNFNVEADPGRVKSIESLSEVTDATDRLSYVISLTEKAANRTMDLVDESMPVAGKIKEDARALHDQWVRLGNRAMSADEFRQLYKEMGGFLNELAANTDGLYSNLSEIMVAQDYQDLTGQVIQRVVTLVRDIERSLVVLVKMASNVDSMTGQVHEPKSQAQPPVPKSSSAKGHGPQINTDQEDVVANQDDVDDLLSSLGF